MIRNKGDRQHRNAQCACGSGKKYKRCCDPNNTIHSVSHACKNAAEDAAAITNGSAQMRSASKRVIDIQLLALATASLHSQGVRFR